MRKRMEVPCIQDEIEAGRVLLPEKGPSACAIEPFSPSSSSVNIGTLPTIACMTCSYRASSAGEGAIIVEEGGPPHQIIGSNPVFYQVSLERQCRIARQQR